MDSLREFAFSGDDAKYRGLKSVLARLYNTFAYRSIPAFIENGAILDVGSGLGTYLLLLKALGWRVHGIEPGRNAARYAKDHFGLDVKSGYFEDAAFPENHFDVITMWHSLEHFSDPRSILLKANSLLKPGGVMLVGVPNYDSLDRKIFRENWNGLEIPLHLFHFTPCALQTAMECTGFHCRRVVHTIRPPDFAKSLRNFLREQYEIGEGTFVRYLTLFASILPTLLFGLLKNASIIVVHAVKLRPIPLDQPSTVSYDSGGSGMQAPSRKESTPEGFES
jgi:SAM-dependent methyltransferase